MLDAAKIRKVRGLLRHVGMPVTAFAISIAAGATLGQFVLPTLGDRLAEVGNSASRLADAELMAVESVAPAGSRHHKLASPPRPSQNTVSQTAATQDTLVTSPEAVIPQGMLTPQTQTPVQTTPDITPTTPAGSNVTLVQGQARQAPAVQTNAAVTTVTQPAQQIVDDRPMLAPGERIFNGRRIRPARTLTMVTTAYSPDERSCGIHADGITASGKSVWTNGMKMVAADTRLLPFGTIVSIPGYYNDQPVPVLDRGGAIKGHRLDLLYPTHEIAMKWGRKKQTVTVWEYVD